MFLAAKKLKHNLYSILGIEPQGKPSTWEQLEEHEILAGTPEDIVHMDWSGEWNGPETPSID